MTEVELKINPRTVFGFIFVLIGIVIIFIGVIGAFLGPEHITNLIGTEITETQAFVEVFGWFFGLFIEVLGGFFLAFIGTKIIKK